MADSHSKAWFPLYIGDYLADTAELSTEEHGAYLLLLMHYWRNGPLTLDDTRLQNICGLSRHKFSNFKPVFLKKFYEKDGKYFNRRLDREIAKAVEISEKRSEAAKARWGASEDASALQLDTQSQSQSHIKKKEPSVPKKKGTRIDPDFTPTQDMLDWAKANAPNINPHEHTERFIDYWKGRTGQLACKLDWPATWRNWIRKANDDAKPNRESGVEREERKARELLDSLRSTL